MQKECEYCGLEFEAQRSDAKYCSGTCKNNAYLARKANPEIANVSDNSTINGNSMSHRRINVQQSVPLTPAAVNKMIHGLSSNTDILNNLLAEKDNLGDSKASIVEYRLRLFYMERDFNQSEKKVAELQAEVIRLTEKVETNEGSLTDKVLAFCEGNPNIVMTVLDKLDKLGLSNAPAQAINKTPPAADATEN